MSNIGPPGLTRTFYVLRVRDMEIVSLHGKGPESTVSGLTQQLGGLVVQNWQVCYERRRRRLPRDFAARSPRASGMRRLLVRERRGGWVRLRPCGGTLSLNDPHARASAQFGAEALAFRRACSGASSIRSSRTGALARSSTARRAGQFERDSSSAAVWAHRTGTRLGET